MLNFWAKADHVAIGTSIYKAPPPLSWKGSKKSGPNRVKFKIITVLLSYAVVW